MLPLLADPEGRRRALDQGAYGHEDVRHWRRWQRCEHDPGSRRWSRHRGQGGPAGVDGSRRVSRAVQLDRAVVAVAWS